LLFASVYVVFRSILLRLSHLYIFNNRQLLITDTKLIDSAKVAISSTQPPFFGGSQTASMKRLGCGCGLHHFLEDAWWRVEYTEILKAKNVTVHPTLLDNHTNEATSQARRLWIHCIWI